MEIATGDLKSETRDDRLPKLVSHDDLKGDLQVHTNWTDGNNTIIEMAEAARRTGLEYVAITDHSRTLGIARGLNKQKLEEKKRNRKCYSENER